MQSRWWAFIHHGNIDRRHGIALGSRFLPDVGGVFILLLHRFRLVLAQFRLNLLVQFLQLSFQFAQFVLFLPLLADDGLQQRNVHLQTGIVLLVPLDDGRDMQQCIEEVAGSTLLSISAMRNRSGNRQVKLHNNLSVSKPLYLGTELEFNYATRDYLYHPDTLLLPSEIDMLTAITDPSNSYDSHSHMFENSARVSLYQTAKCKPYPDLPMSMEYQRWNIVLTLPVRHERLDYERGMIDTVATQNTVFLNASASSRLMSKDGKHDLRFSLSHNRYSAQLMNRIGWRDDSQPLIVREGNPGLKGNVTTNANIDYFDKNAHGHQQSMHVGTSLNYQHRSTAQSASYDPVSGVYTYQPMNVKGAYTLKSTFDFSRTIDEKRYWSWQTNADAGYHHSIDHAMLTGMTASEENIVNTLTLHDGAYIQYNKGTLNIRATGDIRWRHSEGKMQDFETLNATDFQYGLSARYILPRLNTTLSADGNMYSRRGYGSSELNTDDFVLNASISQPFFKSKLIARIEAFDLLHQLSNTQYTVNAQGRTETWYRSLPHYVMAHLVYHWNKNPKKK